MKKTLMTIPIAAITSLPMLTMADGHMSFFITSTGGGDGANYGGLAGADTHCQSLAEAVGEGDKSWHAYLSTSGRLDFQKPENNVAAALEQALGIMPKVF